MLFGFDLICSVKKFSVIYYSGHEFLLVVGCRMILPYAFYIFVVGLKESSERLITVYWRIHLL